MTHTSNWKRISVGRGIRSGSVTHTYIWVPIYKYFLKKTNIKVVPLVPDVPKKQKHFLTIICNYIKKYFT